MKIIGITGGVGSGKSKVLQLLADEYQAVTKQLDEVAYDLQQPGTSCFRKIVEAFGETVLTDQGELDRKKLGQIVFADPIQRNKIEQIVHPAVREWILQDIEKQKKMGVSLYVIEAALLIEANYSEICSEMWYINTDEHIRRERLKQTRQYSDEKVTQIMTAQLSSEQYAKAVSVVIDNSGDFTTTKEIIKSRMERLI